MMSQQGTGATGWEWLCGVNSTDLDSSGAFLLDGNGNTCHADALDTLPHLGFLLASAAVLLAGFCTRCRKRQPKPYYLVRFPGHAARWITSLALLVVLITSLIEGILTDATYIQSLGASQPHLYLPAVFALLAVVASLVYTQHMEMWERGAMALLLLLYYGLAAVGEIGRLVDLRRQGQASLEVTRFVLTLLHLLAFLVLFLLEINVVRLKVLCRRGQDRKTSDDLDSPGMLYRENVTNFLSTLLFWWLNWLFFLGYKKPIEMADLGRLPKDYSAEVLHKRFKREYKKEERLAATKGRQPSIGKVIVRLYALRMTGAGILKLVGDFSGLIGPLCIAGIVEYVASIYYNEETGKKMEPHFVTVTEFMGNGFVLIILAFFACTVQFVTAQKSFYFSVYYGMCLRSSMQTMVYEKSLSLSTFATTGGAMTMGQITNHMSTDSMNLLFMFQFFQFLWTVPFLVSMVLYLLYEALGSAALVGSVVYIIVIPLQMFVANFMAKYQKIALEFADERLKHSNEMLQGIKLLKSYGWEHLHLKAVEIMRNRELGALLKMNIAYGAIGFIVSAAPLTVTLLTFGTYTAFSGKPLTPEKAFSSLALFNQLTGPLFMLPLVTSSVINGVISIRRLQRFFKAQEVERKPEGNDWRDRASSRVNIRFRNHTDVIHETSADEFDDYSVSDVDETTRMLPNTNASNSKAVGSYSSTNQTNVTKNRLLPSVAIKITNGNFNWDEASCMPTLANINVEIPAGKLTMVIGSVGSGKSSLVSAIQGEMTTLSGSVQFNEHMNTVAYAAQRAWLINATLQDNILFGNAMEKKRYKKTIEVCALKPDIEILPGGDQTEIGEKGINMSGGQKQRISVARTVYSNRDIVILDDPLSALDVHVGMHVFNKAVIGTLLRKKRTVLLVTHQLQYMSQADKIIVMRDGKITHQGNLQDIIDEAPDIYSEYQQAVKAATESETESEDILSRLSVDERKEVLKRHISMEISQTPHTISTGAKLIGEEDMERGSVTYKVYAFYCRSMTWAMTILFVAGYVANAGFTMGTNFWLSTWSEAGISSDNSTEKPLSYYIGGYAGLSVGGVIAAFIGSMFIVVGVYIASKRLHISMLRNITKCSMRFFDTTPIGRILNRLASDTTLMDTKLLQSIDATIYFIVGYISGLVVNSIILPIFIIFIVPMMITYYFLAKFYITTTREIQRLDSVTRSPVFAHFSESLGGLPTIRAYRDQSRFYNMLVKKINANNTAYLYVQTTHRWAGMRLEMIGVIGILVVGIGTIISAINGTLEPSKVGLAVSYTLMVANFMNFAVRYAAEAETQMNAIERIKEYIGVPNEDYSGTEPEPDWPRTGEIQIQEVSVRYARELDPVLKNISATFRSGEKVGICGRTGSGKSSLTLALFRIIDICKGRILIDGVDISTVPLTTLRQRIAIIPQDPVLFHGTIRFNLDPESHRTDAELWQSLEISQLKDTVSQLPRGLDYEVSEGGENFSLGQRQLFCLARAFLRQSKILIMDEATASIDVETDKILQNVVATVFADRTILTIAHRVVTILDSDSIMTLRDGEMVEYDTPGNLMANPDSIFASLVHSNQ